MFGTKDDLSVTIDGDAAGLERALAGADAATRRAEKAALDYDLSLRKLEVDNMRLAKSLDDLAAKKLAAQNKAFTTAGKAMVYFGGAVAVGLAMAVKASANFNAEMAQVQSLTRASAKTMDQLRQSAQNPAFVKIGVSATDAAKAEVELVKAGISAKDIIGGALPGALNLAAAGQMDVASATEIAASAMVQFGLKGKDIPHLADLLAAGADKALGSVGDLGEGLKMVGTTAHQAGLSVEDTVGVLTEFAAAGLKGSLGGTAFRQMLLKMEAPSTKAESLMKKYGISLYDAAGQMKSMPQIAGNLKQALDKLTPAQRNTALATIFGARAVQAANVLYQQGAKGTADYIKKVNDAGFAQQQAAGKMNSLTGDAQKLKAAMTDVGISVGDQLQAPLRSVTQDLTGMLEAFNSLPDPVKHYIALLASTTAALSLLGGGTLLTIVKLRKLGEEFPTIAARMGKMSKGMMAARAGAFALGVGLQELGSHVGKTDKSLGQLVSAAGDAAMGFAVGGPWGAAIGGGIGMLKMMVDNANSVGDTFKSLTLQVDANTRALSDNSKEQIRNALLQSGALDAAKQLGLNLAQVTLAAEGNTQAYAAVNGQLEKMLATQQRQDQFARGPNYTERSINAVKDALGASNGAIADARHNQQLLNQTRDAGTASTKQSTAAVDQNTSATDQNTAALKKNQAQRLAAINKQVAFQQAIDDATKAAHDNAHTLNLTAQAGRDNMSALTGMASAWDSLTTREKNADGAYQHARQTFIQLAEQMGATKKRAQELADQLLNIPDAHPKVTLNDAQALHAIRQIQFGLGQIHDKTITVSVIESRNFKMNHLPGTFNANGALYERHDAQIAAPGAWRVWAEPETGGEAYIPLAASKRPRSRRIAAETVARLGGDVQWFADGGFDWAGFSPNLMGGAMLARPANVSLKEWQQAVQGLSISSTSTLKEVRDQLNQFGKAIHKAGGVWTKDIVDWADKVMQSAKTLDDERTERDNLKQELSDDRTALSNLRSAMASYQQGVSGNFTSSPFGQTVDIANVGQVGGLKAFSILDNSNYYDAKDMLTAEKKLIGEGLGKTALFKDLAASGDVQTAQELAALGRRQAMSYVNQYARAQQMAHQVGQVASRAVYGQQLADQRALVESVHSQVQHQNQLIREEIKVLKGIAGQVHDGAASGVHHGLASAASGAQHPQRNRPRSVF